MTVSRHESATGSISYVTREVPARSTSSLHSAWKLCTSRRGGSTSSTSPWEIGPGAFGVTPCQREPASQSVSTPTPKVYFARISLLGDRLHRAARASS